MLLLLLWSASFVVHANGDISCWPHNFTRPDKFCSVEVLGVEVEKPRVIWDQGHTCKRVGCEHDDKKSRCCCATNLCNKLSLVVLDRAERSAELQMYTASICAILIIIAQHLTLILICKWHSFRESSRVVFSERMNIDLEEVSVEPGFGDEQLGPVVSAIRQFAEEGSSNSDPSEPLQYISYRGVFTYGTNDKITIRETTASESALKNITETSTMSEILIAVLSAGPREIAWEAPVVIRILDAAYTVLKAEPTLLTTSAPVAIYGDIHGQYSDVWRWFRLNGWPPETKSLFLGDYVDRGRHSLEVIMLLLLLKVTLPSSMFLVRGNHEEGLVNKVYSFYSEVKYRFPASHYRKVYRKIEEVFSVLPLACVVGGRIFCVHGGLSPLLPTLQQIQEIQRPLPQITKSAQHCGILWSDPQPGCRKFTPNTLRDENGPGIGYLFGTKQIKKFIKENNLFLIVRGHQPPLPGYERVGNHLITLFSTAGYRTEGNKTNMAASMLVDCQGNIDIVRISVSEFMKDRRQRYKMEKGDHYKDCGKPKLKRTSKHERGQYS